MYGTLRSTINWQLSAALNLVASIANCQCFSCCVAVEWAAFAWRLTECVVAARAIVLCAQSCCNPLPCLGCSAPSAVCLVFALLDCFCCCRCCCCCVTRTRANAINFVFNFQFVLVLLPSRTTPAAEAAAEAAAEGIVGKFKTCLDACQLQLLLLVLLPLLLLVLLLLSSVAATSGRAPNVPFDCGTIVFNGARPI